MSKQGWPGGPVGLRAQLPRDWASRSYAGGREPQEIGASRERQVTPDGKQSLSTTSQPRGSPEASWAGSPPRLYHQEGKRAEQASFWTDPPLRPHTCIALYGLQTLPMSSGFSRDVQCAFLPIRQVRKLRLAAAQTA